MKKKIFICIMIIIIVGVVIIYYNDNKTMYGNDIESIVRVIKSNKLYVNSDIEIIDTKDYGEYRLVAFLSNNSPSFIRFRDNGKGNYKSVDTETHSIEDFSTFIIPLHSQDNFEYVVLNVKNSYSNIIGLNFKANDDNYEVIFESHTVDAKWTKLDDTEVDEYSFEWFPIESNSTK